MGISYSITACTEWKELSTLLSFLKNNIHLTDDEIVVQLDKFNSNQLVKDVLKEHDIEWVEFPLNGNFASFKNNIIDYCSKDYIFSLDADEIPSQYLIENIKNILEYNPEIELFLTPRKNIVEGITSEHISKWGWIVDEENRINYPDYQSRIFKNLPSISWKGKVHERIEGAKTISYIPMNLELDLIHIKSIEKQEKQNNFYSGI